MCNYKSICYFNTTYSAKDLLIHSTFDISEPWLDHRLLHKALSENTSMRQAE